MTHFLKSSENSDTYLYGESNKSVIFTFNPIANCSNVFIRGSLRPLIISLIVERGNPVITDTWRIVRFRSFIICNNNIFMFLLSAKLKKICTLIK